MHEPQEPSKPPSAYDTVLNATYLLNHTVTVVIPVRHVSLSLLVAGGPGQLGNKCAIPECDSPRYIDPSGHEHDY